MGPLADSYHLVVKKCASGLADDVLREDMSEHATSTDGSNAQQIPK